VVLLQVRSTSNNAEGDKRVICFQCHSGLHPAVDSVYPGSDMLADCVRFRG